MPSHRDTILDQFSRQAVPFSTAAPIRDEHALRLLVEAAETRSDDLVLDVACGPGIVACAFARVARGVTGIDLTPAMIERARLLASEQQRANVRFEIGDVLPLPFVDAAFSIVVSRFAFHHFQNPAAVLAEMKRVCQPGGRVVVADLTVSEDPRKAEGFHRMEMLRDPSHARAFTVDQLRRLYRICGLAVAAEKFWRMDIDVEGLLERSFPVPGSEDTIRKMFEDSVADDGLGLGTRRHKGRLRFTYSNVILVARQ
ncbi:MAG: methyltransferase domain-containing protein [Deltaproteobacteria bacterium]|nr:methyltransferase domain-containing protein [Deltaproteobacteria bacterium]